VVTQTIGEATDMETIDILLRRLVREEVAAALAAFRAASSLRTTVPATIEGRWLTEQRVAVRIGFALSTLQSWRSEKTGPPYIRVGRQVRYDEEALDAWQGEQPRVE
jgi:predicted DNA-binding transcriptional regulator AlpA